MYEKLRVAASRVEGVRQVAATAAERIQAQVLEQEGNLRQQVEEMRAQGFEQEGNLERQEEFPAQVMDVQENVDAVIDEE